MIVGKRGKRNPDFSRTQYRKPTAGISLLSVGRSENLPPGTRLAPIYVWEAAYGARLAGKFREKRANSRAGSGSHAPGNRWKQGTA
jgi:hypothetical protein